MNDRYILSQQELVFYFHRATARGVCLTLLKEFEEELLEGPMYSALPLVRPTESDATARAQLLIDGEKRLEEMRTMSDAVLMRTASRVRPGQEVLTRTNLNETSVDNYGEKVLFRPSTVDKVMLESALNQGIVGRKRKNKVGIPAAAAAAANDHVFDESDRVAMQLLSTHTKKELEIIIREESVVVPRGKKSKDTLVKAIYIARKSNNSSVPPIE